MTSVSKTNQYFKHLYNAPKLCEEIDPLTQCGRSLRSIHSNGDELFNLIGSLDMFALETFIKFNPEDRVAELCPGKCFGFHEHKCFNREKYKGFPGPYKFEGYAGWTEPTDLQKRES